MTTKAIFGIIAAFLIGTIVAISLHAVLPPPLTPSDGFGRSKHSV